MTFVPSQNLSGNQRGYTLIEMLIALLLLAVGFMALFIVIWSVISSGKFSRDTTTAANLGQDILERAGSLDYDALIVRRGFVAYTSANNAAAGFTRQWRISSAGGMKVVSARISWAQNGTTKSREYTLVRRLEF